MKKSTLTFAQGFLIGNTIKAQAAGKTIQVFDWDRAAEIIKEALIEHPTLSAEAGLQGDWNYTGGVIFKNGKPTNEDYTYLASNWAIPTLILSVDDVELVEVECYTEASESRFQSDSKWDDISITILGINL